MKTLLLIRHAKSDWSQSQDDFDRPITDKGRTDAQLVAMQTSGLIPQNFKIFSSDAVRASQTALIFAKSWEVSAELISFTNDLYTFSGSELEQFIRSAPESDFLIVFGHNEAVTLFVNNFGDILIDNVPTAGLVSITFDCERWNQIKKGKTGTVIFPKELRDDH